MTSNVRIIAVVLVAAGPLLGCAVPKVSVEPGAEGKIRVEIDGELFTEYLYAGNNKPILYPVIGPNGVPMTRNHPMKEVEGEAKDHPHHRSLWFTHGEVNGISFWHENEGAGKTEHENLIGVESGDKGVIRTTNRWVGPDGNTVCTDRRTITFFPLGEARAIDYEVTLVASEGKVVLGDTKEGTMGIRTHPNLRLSNSERHGVTTANGKALNSAGQRDGELWGKRAAWVDYWGTVGEHTVGVAIFDHPSNPRHPTWWHARDYGLVAANAFGVHNFERKEKGTGDMTIEADQSVTFRYRFVFHPGDAEEGRVAERFDEFAKTEPNP